MRITLKKTEGYVTLGNTTVKRNGIVDIMRLVFAILVVMFHFYDNGERAFEGGKFGVEYFVILSGFLFFRTWNSALRTAECLDDSISFWKRYMVKRYIQFFWYALVGYLITFAVTRVYINGIDSLLELQDILVGDIWEILLIKFNGFNRGKALLNAPAWTLGCMLTTEFLIGGLLVFKKEPFILLVLPISLSNWYSLLD